MPSLIRNKDWMCIRPFEAYDPEKFFFDLQFFYCFSLL
jgi:hypothetical protein